MASVSWKGYTWNLRNGGTGGPGYGGWLDTNVTGPDGSGYLTISTSNPSGSFPYGAEMDMTESLGYGTYTLVVGSRLDTLDKNIVFGGLFPYYGGTPFIEFDVCECSRWDDSNPFGLGATVVSLSQNSWYNNANNRTNSNVAIDSGTVHTFVFDWAPGVATYDAYIGTGTGGTNILHSVHTVNIPVPSTEKPIINLWVYDSSGSPGAGDLDAPATSIVLRDFTFTAADAVPTPTVLQQFNLTSSTTASTTAAGITPGAVTDTSGSLTSFTRGTNGYASDSVISAAPASGATSAGTAITTNSYFFATITPLSGKKMSLTSLTINMSKGGTSTPRGYDIRSSVDDYAASLGTANLATTRPTWTGVTIDLSGASFQNVSSPITFRVYVYAPNTGNVVDWDDLVINGTVSDTGTVEQEGYRFRSDNGSETTATWLAVQDTDIIQPTLTNTRLRFVLNSTLDRGAEDFQLEVRPVGGSTFTVIQ